MVDMIGSVAKTPKVTKEGVQHGSSMLGTALAQLDSAFNLLQLDEGLRSIIRQPERELAVSVPVRRDDGSISVYRGFRVQHSSARGPCKGGIRYHPVVDLANPGRQARYSCP